MSAYAYGSLEQPVGGARPAAENPTNKFVAAIAALIPADVLALHALVLTWTTSTDESGTTTITNEALLSGSLFVLLALSLLLFVIGRGTSNWVRKDLALLFIPALAFLAWTALLTTSALTPLIPDDLPRPTLWFGATVLAVLLIALNSRLNPTKK